MIAFSVGNGQLHQISMSEQCNTLDTMHDKQAVLVSSDGGGIEMTETETPKYLIRRVTPLECERLQGYPDKWTDIAPWTDSKEKKHKDADSPRYVALGNSLCLPFWDWLTGRISEQYEQPPTLGSLFDGIGGFPLCWVRHNGKESVRFSSEISEFCIAVLKKHFGDEDAGLEGDIDEYL